MAELAFYLNTPPSVVHHSLDHVEADARALDVVVKARGKGSKAWQQFYEARKWLARG